MSEELIASLKLDKQQFLDDAKEVKENAENTSKDVDKLNKEAQKQTDLTFLKAVQTVQQGTHLLNQLLRLSGHSLGIVGQQVMQTITTTATTLTLLLSAKAALSPWDAAQAAIGITNITLSLLSLPNLIQSQVAAGNLSTMIIKDSNTGIGRLNTFI